MRMFLFALRWSRYTHAYGGRGCPLRLLRRLLRHHMPGEDFSCTCTSTGYFRKVGLRIGLSPGKTQLILHEGYDKNMSPYPLDIPRVATPQVIPGFSSCLGIPRHFSNDQVFITEALHDIGVKHDRLLDLTEDI
jgi:hypothetical protein